jgi:hypothetical protein
MEIALTFPQALRIAERAYDGPSDVLTMTPQPGEDVGSLEWWLTDPGHRRDRGFGGRRDWAGLVTYLELGRHAIADLPPTEFPTEFHLSDEWCRPDKDIIKQGVRHRIVEPAGAERLTRFRITDNGLALMRQLAWVDRALSTMRG